MTVGMPEPGCFDTRFDIAMVDTLARRGEEQLVEMTSILDYAESRSLRREWLGRLRRRLLALQEKLPAHQRASEVTAADALASHLRAPR